MNLPQSSLSRWAFPQCAVSGVLSYQAAAEMGALSLPQMLTAWIFLGLFWGLFIPWVQHRPQNELSDR
ncbi:MAG: DUF2878 family protein [Alphaproteobacteria bacterium]|nr:DUF2878 family protein [Alphaproteobacteria bacterium]